MVLEVEGLRIGSPTLTSQEGFNYCDPQFVRLTSIRLHQSFLLFPSSENKVKLSHFQDPD